MEILLIICTLALTYLTVIHPLMKADRLRREREKLERFRQFQLLSVRLHYPSAKRYDDVELRERFNITESYNNIGRVIPR